MNSCVHCNVENNRLLGFKKADKDMLIMLFFAILSLFGMLIPYNSLLKIVYQFFLIVVLFYFSIKKYSLVLPLFLLMSTSPIRLYASIYSKSITFICFDNLLLIEVTFLALILVRFIIERKINIVKMIPILIIAFIMVLSYFYTDDTTRNLYYNESFFVMLISFCIVPIFIKNKNDFNVLLKSCIVCLIQAAIFIVFSLDSINTVTDPSLVMDRNYASFYYVLIIISSLIYIIDNKSNKFMFSLVLLCSLIVLILLFSLVSRSAFILLCLGILVIIIIKMRKIKHLVLIMFLIAAISVLIYYSGIAEKLIDRFTEEEVESGNGRVDIAIKMLEMFSNRSLIQKIFGTGHNSAFVWWNGVLYTPHNSFIGFLMHYGLLGLAMFLYLFIASALKLIKTKQNRIYLALFIILFSYCFVLEPHSKTEFIFMLIGLYSASLSN